MAMFQQIDHVNIVVADLERSVGFYTEVLGFRETRRATLEGEWINAITGLKNVRANVVYVEPPDGGPRIELLQYESPSGAGLLGVAEANAIGLRHIAIRVSNIKSAARRLKHAGIQFISAPTQVPDGVVKHDAGRKTLCYLRDPDGVILELAEYRE